MKPWLRIYGFCYLSSLILFNYSCRGNSSEKVPESKTAGQSLYETYCISCHGADGKLCVLGAKDLSLTVMTKEEITGIITNGKSTMTPFGSVLSHEEISALADYVQTLKK